MKKIIVEGHRGWAAKYPENTMLSFKEALKLGVDAIEFDVWLTADKVPVIMHDGNSLRTCGTDGTLTKMTLAQVKELEPCYKEKFGDAFCGMGLRVPTLEELLQYCAENYPQIKLGVEIKDYTEETVDLTVELLKKYGFFDDCYFYAFNARIIKYLKTRYNGRTMGYPDLLMFEFQPDSYSYYEEIGISLRVARSEAAPIFLNKGLPMHFYCADTEEDVRFCIEKGADLITANDPVPLLKFLGRM
jgi:glycerophosphoryl diester phosphodiesterase